MNANIEEIRAWLQSSRGERMADGTSKWLEIARKSKVSIRTLTNICSGTYQVPRQKTIRELDAVRKWMSPEQVAKRRERVQRARDAQKEVVKARKADRKRLGNPY